MKYKIICNEGSLEGGGNQDDMEMIIEADTVQDVKVQFYGMKVNNMYGRRIKSITEII